VASAAGDRAFSLFGGFIFKTMTFIFGRGETIRRRPVCSPRSCGYVRRIGKPEGSPARIHPGAILKALLAAFMFWLH